MKSSLTDVQRLQLQNMISTYNSADNTEYIRNLKHSDLIRQDVHKLQEIKKQYGDDTMAVYQYGAIECPFLFSTYTDIFNKIRKDELDISIFETVLDTLKNIENGNLNQHEASYELGKNVLSLYSDSAKKVQEKYENTTTSTSDTLNVNNTNENNLKVDLSWAAFKEQKRKEAKDLKKMKKLAQRQKEEELSQLQNELNNLQNSQSLQSLYKKNT